MVCLHGRRRAWGKCSFPFVCLAAQRGGVSHVFVATSSKDMRSAGRLRRCEPPPPRTTFPQGPVFLHGAACATVSSACRSIAADPSFAPGLSSAKLGARPPAGKRGTLPVHQGLHAHEAAAVRTAYAAPVASTVPPESRHQGHSILLHAASRLTMNAAGRGAVRPLV